MEIAGIGLITAFGAGIVSFLSPCVLPLVPGYVSYVTGGSVLEGDQGAASVRLQVLGLSLCFVLGFSTVFIRPGATATALGQLLLTYRYELNLVDGDVVIGFGVLTEYALPLPLPARVPAEVVRPDGSQAVVLLTAAGPGAYGASVLASQAGVWQFCIVAEGTTMRGRPFTREQTRTGTL